MWLGMRFTYDIYIIPHLDDILHSDAILTTFGWHFDFIRMTFNGVTHPWCHVHIVRVGTCTKADQGVVHIKCIQCVRMHSNAFKFHLIAIYCHLTNIRLQDFLLLSLQIKIVTRCQLSQGPVGWILMNEERWCNGSGAVYRRWSVLCQGASWACWIC